MYTTFTINNSKFTPPARSYTYLYLVLGLGALAALIWLYYTQDREIEKVEEKKVEKVEKVEKVDYPKPQFSGIYKKQEIKDMVAHTPKVFTEEYLHFNCLFELLCFKHVDYDVDSIEEIMQLFINPWYYIYTDLENRLYEDFELKLWLGMECEGIVFAMVSHYLFNDNSRFAPLLNQYFPNSIKALNEIKKDKSMENIEQYIQKKMQEQKFLDSLPNTQISEKTVSIVSDALKIQALSRMSMDDVLMVLR